MSEPVAPPPQEMPRSNTRSRYERSRSSTGKESKDCFACLHERASVGSSAFELRPGRPLANVRTAAYTTRSATVRAVLGIGGTASRNSQSSASALRTGSMRNGEREVALTARPRVHQALVLLAGFEDPVPERGRPQRNSEATNSGCVITLRGPRLALPDRVLAAHGRRGCRRLCRLGVRRHWAPARARSSRPRSATLSRRCSRDAHEGELPQSSNCDAVI